MAEALVLARVDLSTDGTPTGSAWQWAIGHVVDVKPDGWTWQDEEDPRKFNTRVERKFALLRFPGVSVARIQKYVVSQTTIDQFTGQSTMVRGRLWQIQWNALPQAARTILTNTGVLTIGSTAVGGDFTWAQMQNFVLNLATDLVDTTDLSG